MASVNSTFLLGLVYQTLSGRFTSMNAFKCRPFPSSWADTFCELPVNFKNIWAWQSPLLADWLAKNLLKETYIFGEIPDANSQM